MGGERSQSPLKNGAFPTKKLACYVLIDVCGVVSIPSEKRGLSDYYCTSVHCAEVFLKSQSPLKNGAFPTRSFGTAQRSLGSKSQSPLKNGAFPTEVKSVEVREDAGGVSIPSEKRGLSDMVEEIMIDQEGNPVSIPSEKRGLSDRAMLRFS